jgi:hypothetical protein
VLSSPAASLIDSATAFARQVLDKPQALLSAAPRTGPLGREEMLSDDGAQHPPYPVIYCIIQHIFGADASAKLTAGAFHQLPYAQAELAQVMRKLNRRDGGQVFTDIVEQTSALGGERYVQMAYLNGQQPAYGMELVPVPVQGVAPGSSKAELQVVFAVLISYENSEGTPLNTRVAAVHKNMAGANDEAASVFASMTATANMEQVGPHIVVKQLGYGNKVWTMHHPASNSNTVVAVRRVHIRDKEGSAPLKPAKPLKVTFWVFFERIGPGETVHERVSKYATLAEATIALNNVATSAKIMYNNEPALGWSLIHHSISERQEITKVFERLDERGPTQAKLWIRQVMVI